MDDYVLCRIYKKTDKSFKGRQRNNGGGDDYVPNQNEYLSANSQDHKNNAQPGTDNVHYGNHGDGYNHMEDYSKLDIPTHLQHHEIPDISSAEDQEIPNYDSGNFFQSSSDYGFGQTPPTCFLPMSSINPISSWESKPRFMPVPPFYSTTNNVFRTGYNMREAATASWDFKPPPRGFQDFYDFDIHNNLNFVDPEVNLDNILNNHPSSSDCSPLNSLQKRQRD